MHAFSTNAPPVKPSVPHAAVQRTILELDPPHRLVQTEIFEPFPDSVSTVTVTLTETAGVTRLQMRSVYPSKEVRDQVVASGMEDGMRESYRQLTEQVDAMVRGN